MIDELDAREGLNNTLDKTDLDLGKRTQGKVRDIYEKDGRLIIITTDRISAFDHVLGTIPFKGQVLNQITQFWFGSTKDIVRNHVIEFPDPNVMVCRKAEPLPVEVVIRGYLTGSAWRDYEKKKEVSGIKLPEGLKKNQRFEKPLITPSTKAEQGEHDMPISREEIIEQGLVEKDLWEKIEKVTYELFKRGAKIAGKNGLILVDTKYEFGLLDGELILIDEIHTPDSSRYWYKNTYEDKFEKGEDPDPLDKEHVRNWLRDERGFSGDGEPPELSDEIRIEASEKYIKAFEQITGQQFSFIKSPILERIKINLKEQGYLKG